MPYAICILLFCKPQLPVAWSLRNSDDTVMTKASQENDEQFCKQKYVIRCRPSRNFESFLTPLPPSSRFFNTEALILSSRILRDPSTLRLWRHLWTTPKRFSESLFLSAQKIFSWFCRKMSRTCIDFNMPRIMLSLEVLPSTNWNDKLYIHANGTFFISFFSEKKKLKKKRET